MPPCPTSFRSLKEGQPELENDPDSSYNQCLPQDRERMLVWRARHYPQGMTIFLSILLQKLRCQHVQMSVCCQPAVDVVREYMKPLVRKNSIDGIDLAAAAVKNIPTPQVDERDRVFHLR